ncbi:MAG: GHMP kinase [Myxococcales bacterium]|nr:GHMP kinase [Myxococcales bacterium]
MIISKTPMRMSFVGGGSDLSSFYRKHGGAVVSTAIDKYMYITINHKFDSGIRASYSMTEEVEAAHQIKHPLIRAGLGLVGIEGGIELASMADIPSRGTGLGSSSSFTVGLLHALYGFKNQYVSKEQLASESCHIEIEICGDPIGKQDQYAAAYGGLNYIRFHPDESVSVDPIICDSETLQRLQDHILVFYTGRSREASELLAEQTKKTASETRVQQTLIKMVALAADLKRELERNNLDAFGEILHENWALKKTLVDGISDGEIDDWYETGRRSGALGGKLSGAGRGGFMMFFAPPERHAAIVHALPGLREVRFRFDTNGSQIIFYRP